MGEDRAVARRAAPTRLVAAVGLAVQAVTLVVLTVSLARTAATIGDGDGRASLSALVDDLFGPAVYTLAAVLVGLFAVLVLVAAVLAARPGGTGVAGLVVGLVLQVPVTGLAVRDVVAGESGAGEIALLVGAALLLVAVVVLVGRRRSDPMPRPAGRHDGPRRPDADDVQGPGPGTP